MPHISTIYVYPVKSLEGITIPQAIFTEGGTLQYDREFAFFDENGKFIKGKNTPELFALRAVFQIEEYRCTLQYSGLEPLQCSLLHDAEKIEAYMERVCSKRVFFKRNSVQGFPDDDGATGPTMVADASVQAVAEWFPECSVSELIRRFRVNLIVGDAPAFWEDKLFGTAGEVMPFTVGEVRLHGSNPCARCPVPTRDSYTGEIFSGFQKRFAEMRQQTLPYWAEPTRFDHYYRFTTNTITPAEQQGKVLRVGDEVNVSP